MYYEHKSLLCRNECQFYLSSSFVAIPKVRLDTIYICGVDEMSTQDIFAYFKEYPPAHIEWLDDTSCK